MGRAESSGGVREQGAGGRAHPPKRSERAAQDALARGALAAGRSGEGPSGIAHLAAAQLQRGSVAEGDGGGGTLRLGAAAAAARGDDRAVCERPRAAVDLERGEEERGKQERREG